MSELASLFSKVIQDNYLLGREDGSVLIEEKSSSAKTKRVQVSAGKCFGFTLEIDGGHPWSFIVNSPPKGVVSVADGIIVFNYDRIDYILVLDLKSNTMNVKCCKQIESGVLLCSWLFNNLKLHGHTKVTEVKYIRLVVASRRFNQNRHSKTSGLRLSKKEYKNNLYLIANDSPLKIKVEDLIDKVK